MTEVVKTFVLQLPCGCPASWVHADNLLRASQILWGDRPPTWVTRGCQLAEVATPAEGERAYKELQKAGAGRRECRGFHKAGKP